MHELMQRFQGSTALPLLPNYAFSSALANYYLYKEEREGFGGESVTATGVHGVRDNRALDCELVNAVVTFPMAVVALVKVMQDQVRRGGGAL